MINSDGWGSEAAPNSDLSRPIAFIHTDYTLATPPDETPSSGC
jgi:hypothetical protein